MRAKHLVGSGLTLVVALAIPLSLSACTPASTPQPSSSSDILTRALPTDVTARGVLLAAVILKVGDIDASISDGLVTPAEVDEAKLALEQGTLSLWEQRAAADK